MTFFGLFAPIVATQFGQRYRTGWKSEEGVPILVTNGVGTVTVPLRFFARPRSTSSPLGGADAAAL